MQGGFLALFRSGAMPLFPVFSVYRGLFVFSIQKNRIIHYEKKYFYTIFLFFYSFFETFAHSCKDLTYVWVSSFFLLGKVLEKKPRRLKNA
ncbi:hypothetical protein BREVNS_2081 [Brevinematales bacterium NS]|nr:hypothetical protein BREVNS_2081 [Brevinematales bacterium NS]